MAHMVQTCNTFVLIDQQENYEIMRKFIILRSSLVPYSYSNARTAYDEGMITPRCIVDGSLLSSYRTQSTSPNVLRVS